MQDSVQQESVLTLLSVVTGIWGLRPHLWYDQAEVVQAWRLVLQTAREHETSAGPTMHYDLVDIGRNVLSKLRCSMSECFLHPAGTSIKHCANKKHPCFCQLKSLSVFMHVQHGALDWGRRSVHGQELSWG